MRKLTILFFAIALAASGMAQNSFLNDTTSTLVKMGGIYMLGSTALTSKQVGQLYQAQCPAAYAKYKSARACTAAGATVFAIGGLELVAIGACNRIISTKKLPLAYSFGSIISGTGLIVMLCAPLKYNKAVDVYNDRHNYQLTIAPSVGTDGVGIALRW